MSGVLILLLSFSTSGISSILQLKSKSFSLPELAGELFPNQRFLKKEKMKNRFEQIHVYTRVGVRFLAI